MMGCNLLACWRANGKRGWGSCRLIPATQTSIRSLRYYTSKRGPYQPFAPKNRPDMIQEPQSTVSERESRIKRTTTTNKSGVVDLLLASRPRSHGKVPGQGWANTSEDERWSVCRMSLGQSAMTVLPGCSVSYENETSSVGNERLQFYRDGLIHVLGSRYFEKVGGPNVPKCTMR